MREPTTTPEGELADLLERERRVAPPRREEGSDRLIPIAEAVTRLGKSSRSVIYAHFDAGRLTRHVVGGRVYVDETELDPLMFEPSREAPRPARAAPTPLTLRDSVPHASRALRAGEDRHRQRVEHLLADILGELQELRTALTVAHRRTWP